MKERREEQELLVLKLKFPADVVDAALAEKQDLPSHLQRAADDGPFLESDLKRDRPSHKHLPNENFSIPIDTHAKLYMLRPDLSSPPLRTNWAVGVLCEKSPDRPSVATTPVKVCRADLIISASDVPSQPLLFPRERC